MSSIQKQQAKIKKQMRDDILGTQSVANQLTGKERIGTAKLNKTETKKAEPTKVDIRKLEKFIDFMEESYESGTSKVEIKRKV